MAILLVPFLGCAEPTAPPSPVRSYRLTSLAATGLPVSDLPARFTIPGGTARLRISSGSLTLRPDSTYELLLNATRDSADRTIVLPPIASHGRYSIVPTVGDELYDYHLTFEHVESPDHAPIGVRSRVGHVGVCCLWIEDVWLTFFFHPCRPWSPCS